MKVDAVLMTTDIGSSAGDVRRCEDHGFDGVFTFEGPHDPFLPLAVAAAATEKVQLGTAVAIAFARNPMTCAYVANDLQLLSRGRFILGLGTQIRPHIERRFSQPWSRPNARMREFVRAVRAIWRSWNEGEKLDFRGEFYTHTLMPPLLSPGPNPFGTPPIFLAGFGPDMVRVAGEAADGWIVHPLHTRDFLIATILPALEQGRTKAGSRTRPFEVSCQTITMVGSNDEEISRARAAAKAQVAFYSSTPAYRGVLEHHGWGDLQTQFHRLSKEGKWEQMVELVSDELLDRIGVCGTPLQVADRLCRRNDFADRTTLLLYNETEPDAVVDIVRAMKETAST
jgi:probable F420-dependent oxidoreductase